MGDFDSDTTDPTLKVIGDTSIWGGVAYRNPSRDRFRDNFTLNLGFKSYKATFNWQALTTDFDGQIVVDGTPYSFTTPPPSGSIDLGTLTGDDLVVIIDPIFGVFPDTPDEVGTWDLELAQVPPPTGGLLMLTALGGMGIAGHICRKY